MTVETQQPTGNEYAVARALNKSVNDIFSIATFFQIIGPLKGFDEVEMNRVYILLVNELEILYESYPKLLAIEPEPLWREYETIKGRFYSIQKTIEKGRQDSDHYVRINKQCIIAEIDTPQLTEKQQRFIDDAQKVFSKHMEMLITELDRQKAEDPDNYYVDQFNPRDLRTYCINEYKLTYKLDGSILINDVMRLKRVHAGSTTERLIEQAIKNPNELFKPNLGKTARNLSTILSSAGFTPILRDIFFPIVNDDKGIIFRPNVTREQLQSERIDTFDLDALLLAHGAAVEMRPREELEASGIFDFDDED